MDFKYKSKCMGYYETQILHIKHISWVNRTFLLITQNLIDYNEPGDGYLYVSN